MAILMMRFVYLIRLQLVLNKQMHSVTYRGSKKKLLQKPIIRDMITQNRQRKSPAAGGLPSAAGGLHSAS